MLDVTCLDSYGEVVTNLTQWDVNQSLIIKNTGLTTAPLFHFCNKNSTEALVVASTLEDGVITVDIPNVMLQYGIPIIAYLYAYSSLTSGKTLAIIKIPVRPRPKPSEYEYVENIDVISLALIEEKINNTIQSMEDLKSEVTAKLETMNDFVDDIDNIQNTLDAKADKVTNDGFIAGKNATNVSGGVAIGNYAKTTGAGAAIGSEAEADSGFSGGYHAKGTGMGAAVGNSASAFHGGAVGYAANASTGGAVGENAHAAEGGGAVGENANTEGGGGAVGYNSRSSYGGAMGEDASSFDGAAVGQSAKTGDGVAVGKEAKTIDSSNNGIDAIQLGTGTNNTAKTMQVYDKRIVEADGSLTDVGNISELNTSNKTNVVAAINEKAPVSHATIGTTYGVGDAGYYGHVRLSDSTNSTSSTTNGTAATPAAVKTAYDLAIATSGQMRNLTDTTAEFDLNINDGILDIGSTQLTEYYKEIYVNVDLDGEIYIKNMDESNTVTVDLTDESTQPFQNGNDTLSFWTFIRLDINQLQITNTGNMIEWSQSTAFDSNGIREVDEHTFDILIASGTVKWKETAPNTYGIESDYTLNTSLNDKEIKLADGYLASLIADNSSTAIGVGAVVEEGGGAIGNNSYSNGGGGALGVNTSVIDGGGAIGNNASANGGGGAMGYTASATTGCAIGNYSKTGAGVAVGRNARTVDSGGNGIDAIQLGTGTNSTEKTMQVYNKRIVEANGSLTDVGDLTTLETSNKTNVVNAINSIVSSIDTPKSSAVFGGDISYSEQFSINLTGGFWVVGLNIPAITITDDFFGTFTIPAMTGVEFADTEHGGRCYVKYTFSVNDPSGTLSAQDVTNAAVLKEAKGKANNYMEIEDGCIVASVYIYVGNVTVSSQQNNDNQTEYYGSFTPVSNASAPLLKAFYKSS